MKKMTSTKPTASEMAPARMESAPSSGPTLCSSITVSGAGSAPARSSNARSVAPWASELPLICARPPVIASRITGALMTSIVEHDGKGMADIGARHLGELAGAEAVEGDVHDPAAGLRILPGLGIGEIGAIDHDRLLDRELLAGIALHGQELITERRCPAGIGVHAFIDEMEGHMRGFAQQLLDALRVGNAGELDHDAVLALLRDLRIDDAGAVDAAADDFDRLGDGGGGAGLHGRLGEGEDQVRALAARPRNRRRLPGPLGGVSRSLRAATAAWRWVGSSRSICTSLAVASEARRV